MSLPDPVEPSEPDEAEPAEYSNEAMRERYARHVEDEYRRIKDAPIAPSQAGLREMRVKPSKRAKPFCTPDPTFCGVCQKPAVALGYTPLNQWKDLLGPVMWVCADPKCHGEAAGVYLEDEPADSRVWETIKLGPAYRPQWFGRCAYCGKQGDASQLFGYSIAAGDSKPSFCDADKKDCLEKWIEKKRRGPR